jgi:hypothetical protein
MNLFIVLAKIGEKLIICVHLAYSSVTIYRRDETETRKYVYVVNLSPGRWVVLIRVAHFHSQHNISCRNHNSTPIPYTSTKTKDEKVILICKGSKKLKTQISQFYLHGLFKGMAQSYHPTLSI